MRIVLTLLFAISMTALGQPPTDARLLAQLKRLFPDATSFSPKVVTPPHFKALKAGANGVDQVIGFAFWTTEVDPLERGYGGPIKILVGLNPGGFLTGIVLAEHHEPYGEFSIEPPAFAAQFAGKRISDPFRVGADIDAVSRASITVGSATRTVRNSARRIARELLAK